MLLRFFSRRSIVEPSWGDRDLESINIKFVYPPQEFTEVFYEEQQRVLKWHKKASKHARLRLSPSCTHVHQDLRDRSVEYLDLMDPFQMCMLKNRS